ncbi:hypothetical protein ACFQGT_14390 [Natrialbaceae archaeon GCM10025810]|uniref:hypothetical protein n=1 Tax=Halovalidus salilacus TaxID=3075124 RepID=UPI0036218C63
MGDDTDDTSHRPHQNRKPLSRPRRARRRTPKTYSCLWACGSRSKFDTCVETVLAFYEYLRDNAGEQVSEGDLEDLVAPLCRNNEATR